MESTLRLEYFSEFFEDFQNELYCETYERPLLSGEITKTLNSKMFGMNFNCLQLCYGHLSNTVSLVSVNRLWISILSSQTKLNLAKTALVL